MGLDLVGAARDPIAEMQVCDVPQQERSAHHAPKFTECLVQPVLAALVAHLAQQDRRGGLVGLA
jgi:hypothetical protein